VSATVNRELASQAAASVRHPLTLTLLTLTFTTGLIDATSYLGLGHVFTANMTGNVVLLGFGIAGTAGLPVISPIVSMVSFVIGAGLGGFLGTRIERLHPVHLGVALVIEVLLVAAAGALAAILPIHANRLSGDVIVALLAFAMGVRNATVRRVAVPDLTTTVLTMTLTGLAADSRLVGNSGAGTLRRVAAVSAMLVGAVAGALLVRSSLTLPLAAAAALALVTAVGYGRWQRGLQPRPEPPERSLQPRPEPPQPG
jgi:uncharacterized membrane protein YoaK (UPF0700 family)